ncbi:uncharacterized protein AMSG_11871 [Thecamonas trahens ATCC 50062]|uniref:Guanylate cyclase domain-containing protein n=1 Tax=Thecamonas trahens ATCC 50062 TaxID=461836 RepID=A0A0L0DAP0_THETB|nr:hypothetical protein AMSG_11871 [Thecamonas trahens ATCC 50062]KNC49300.1 hypothetical protein AMSG_11871 [Thecamonas trahens ATCC 50062]|eukprot:XP_013758069.1 hypothetical protein AMSG_11871 [Thecamonas trahens ATCC 50062]
MFDDVCGSCFGPCGGCGGSAANVTDSCGVCGGDNTTCSGCDGRGAVYDACGVCGGNTSTCAVFCDGVGAYFDCAGVCGGSAVVDSCNVCSGSAGLVPTDFHKDSCKVCFGGNAALDECGECFGNNAALDSCGICGGGDVARDSCGLCFGTNRFVDVCGVCFGNATSCIGCDFVAFSGAQDDACGVCAGTNACLATRSSTSTQYMLWLAGATAGMLICGGLVFVVLYYLRAKEAKIKYVEGVIEAAAVDAPSGKITLMFTDVESSTTLWEDHPEAMKKAMEMHNAVFHDLIDLTGGYEVRTEGDAFIIAYKHAGDAVACALQLQSALMEAPWPDELLKNAATAEVPIGAADGSCGQPSETQHELRRPTAAMARSKRGKRARGAGSEATAGAEAEEQQDQVVDGLSAPSSPSSSWSSSSIVDSAMASHAMLFAFKPSPWLFRGLRVRVGLHTCKPERVFDERTQRFNYIGPHMIQAQAIGDAGHGGQTVVSHTTVAALRNRLFEGAELVRLGTYAFDACSGEFDLYSLHAKLLAGRQFPTLRAKALRVSGEPVEVRSRTTSVESSVSAVDPKKAEAAAKALLGETKGKSQGAKRPATPTVVPPSPLPPAAGTTLSARRRKRRNRVAPAGQQASMRRVSSLSVVVAPGGPSRSRSRSPSGSASGSMSRTLSRSHSRTASQSTTTGRPGVRLQILTDFSGGQVSPSSRSPTTPSMLKTPSTPIFVRRRSEERLEAGRQSLGSDAAFRRRSVGRTGAVVKSGEAMQSTSSLSTRRTSGQLRLATSMEHLPVKQ